MPDIGETMTKKDKINKSLYLVASRFIHRFRIVNLQYLAKLSLHRHQKTPIEVFQPLISSLLFKLANLKKSTPIVLSFDCLS